MCTRPRLEAGGPRRPWKSLEDVITIKTSCVLGYNSDDEPFPRPSVAMATPTQNEIG